jgi:hypothetical protein
MPDPQLVELLYARRTLAEMTSKWREQTDVPADSDLGKMVQARVLLEQGKQEEAQDILMGLIVDAEETRVKLWAAKALRDLGLWPGGPMAQEAQGVVFEVPMEGNQDVLAAYRDTCVRFFSYSGSMAFYEPSSNVQAITQLCQQLISAADKIAENPKPATYRPGDPHVTILTIRGEIPVGLHAGGVTLLNLGAPLIGVLTSLIQDKKPE